MLYPSKPGIEWTHSCSKGNYILHPFWGHDCGWCQPCYWSRTTLCVNPMAPDHPCIGVPVPQHIPCSPIQRLPLSAPHTFLVHSFSFSAHVMLLHMLILLHEMVFAVYCLAYSPFRFLCKICFSVNTHRLYYLNHWSCFWGSVLCLSPHNLRSPWELGLCCCCCFYYYYLPGTYLAQCWAMVVTL